MLGAKCISFHLPRDAGGRTEAAGEARAIFQQTEQGCRGGGATRRGARGRRRRPQCSCRWTRPGGGRHALASWRRRKEVDDTAGRSGSFFVLGVRGGREDGEAGSNRPGPLRLSAGQVPLFTSSAGSVDVGSTGGGPEDEGAPSSCCSLGQLVSCGAEGACGRIKAERRRGNGEECARGSLGEAKGVGDQDKAPGGPC